jgi:hypothetical protein
MPTKVYSYDPVTKRMVYVRTAKTQPRERVRLPLADSKLMDKSMADNTRAHASRGSLA